MDIEKLQEENLELKKENALLKNEIQHFNKIVFDQNRYASMGEMIDTIAHQWRQPLTELSSLFMIHESKARRNDLIDSQELLDSIENLNDLTSYMSSTIEDFRKFLSTNKKSEEFHIAHSINDVVKLISSSINRYGIKVDIVIKKNTLIKGVKNEFSQAILNIVTNAKDALVDKNIQNPKIKITLDADELFTILMIEDNAGGININPIEKIFEPFFTKDKKNGSGVGLFLSKLIIDEHMKGNITVKNSENGAKFIVKIKN